ncbi:MAG: hypothetical protein K6U08_08250 [Firmicutes bacterium]|nr:hypothetical protein [Bacillota bacterium]
MIKVGGRSVYPEEVEEVLLEMDGISDCRVYGVPEQGLGEMAVADLVGDGGFGLDAIRAHCASKLGAFKIPRRVQWVESIPRTGHAKILRRLASEGA